MISVIIPTYKSPDMLDLCLRSAIKGQQHKNQIIVVVDGFYELNKEVLDRWKDSIDILPLETNQGLCRGTNLGVYNAKHDRILIVNDDDTLRELLRLILELRGYLGVTARDGISGLKKLKQDSYDLLITDNQMPGMEGLELIEEISRREMGIRTLLISGQLTKEVVESAKARGVLECLPKPFSLNLLIEIVNKAFKRDTVPKMKHKIYQHTDY